MAHSYGKKLLDEVKEENLAEILREIRVDAIQDASETDSSGLGIAPLGKLCDIFRAGQERTTGEAAGGHQPVIEITSPGSGDGKTSLLYYIIAVGTLPSDINGIHLGGKGRAVVFLDTDYRFDAGRLREVMRGVVQNRYQKQHHGEYLQVEYDTMDIVNECLRHVHVFRPQSTRALLSTIRSVESYLYGQHTSTSRCLHAVILDSASAFYWQDRREAEVSNIPGASIQEQGLSMVQIARETVQGLQHLQHIFTCPVLYTTWGMQHRAPQNVEPSMNTPFHSFRPPHLSHPWASFPTLRVVVRRDAVRSFPPDIAIGEAEGEADARQRIVGRGEFTAWVDRAGSDVTLGRNETFGFWVRREGVGLSQ